MISGVFAFLPSGINVTEQFQKRPELAVSLAKPIAGGGNFPQSRHPRQRVAKTQRPTGRVPYKTFLSSVSKEIFPEKRRRSPSMPVAKCACSAQTSQTPPFPLFYYTVVKLCNFVTISVKGCENGLL